MKYLAPILLIAAVIGAVLFVPWYKNRNKTVPVPRDESATIQIFRGEKLPEGFKGPTSLPHVNGPSAPPPY